jgi:serine/threonine protein kinase
MFPAADPLALDLLTKLLRFDPMQRISAAEALSHPYFDVLKTRDYIHSYKAKNQHIFDDDVLLTQAAATSISPASRILQQKQQGELALRPDPMNVDIEKVGESPENLKRNVSEPRGRRWVRGDSPAVCVYRSCRRCSTTAAETRRCRLPLPPPLPPPRGRPRRPRRRPAVRKARHTTSRVRPSPLRAGWRPLHSAASRVHL